jgi:hypothetical protein
VARAKQLDVDGLLTKLERWVAKQPKGVRLVKGKPMSDAQIDRIPALLKQFPFSLPTPYDPKRFVIPAGYRALLRRCGGVRLEVREDDDDDFEPYGPFHIFRPGSCAKAHMGASGPTLCDSWSVSGTEMDGREITTTELVSFATIGHSVEASRWCFYLGGKGALTIFEESNDYECLAGRYVDDGTPLSKAYRPMFPSFDRWFATTIAAITKQPLDLERPETVTNAIYKATG